MEDVRQPWISRSRLPGRPVTFEMENLPLLHLPKIGIGSYLDSSSGINSNLVTSTRPLSEMRSSGITTNASRDNCIFGLFSLQPQDRKPARIVSVFLSTTSTLSLDMSPPISNSTPPI